jgi:hypothetical protein
MLLEKWVKILGKEVWFNHLSDSTIIVIKMKTDVNVLISINTKLILSVQFSFVINNSQLI